ncbi:MAG: hypothetical protein ABJC13_15960 [Acidobacteriota bacterium]
MTEESKETRLDQVLRKVKDHPVLAVLLTIGLSVVALGQLTGAIDSILSFAAKRYGDQAQHPVGLQPEDKVDRLDGAKETPANLVEIPSQVGASETANMPAFIPPNADEILKTKCKEKYDTDFSMREYCVRTQREALEKLGVVPLGVKENAASHKADEILKTKCKGQYGTDFIMLEYCVRTQREALAKLGVAPPGMPENVVQAVRKRCFEEYPADFSMREYCQRTQFEAYEKLQQ